MVLGLLFGKSNPQLILLCHKLADTRLLNISHTEHSIEKHVEENVKTNDCIYLTSSISLLLAKAKRRRSAYDIIVSITGASFHSCVGKKE